MAFEKDVIYMAPTCPADDLPGFRQAFPTAESLNDEGVDALVSAVILRTAHDYYMVCKNPDHIHVKGNGKSGDEGEITMNALMTKDMIEKFVDGPLFESMSNIHPEVFKKTIRKIADSGKDFPTLRYEAKPQTPPTELEERPTTYMRKRFKNREKKIKIA